MEESSFQANASANISQNGPVVAMGYSADMNGSSTITQRNSSSLCDITVPDVLLVLFGSAAALMNGLLLLVLYNERKKFFRTRVSFLVANLALADFFTGLTLVLVMALLFSHKLQDLHGFQFYFLCGSIQTSFYTLILMSLDRLIVTVFPMTWSKILTKRSTILGILFAWGFAIFGSFMVKYQIGTKKKFAFLLFIEITAVLVILIHVAIFCVLRRQRRNLTSQQSGSSAGELSTVMDLTLQACHAHITSVVLTLMLVLVIAYTPYIVCMNILLARDGTNMGILLYDNVFRYMQAFSYLNYAANPIVYAWRLRVYRKALCQLILKMTF